MNINVNNFKIAFNKGMAYLTIMATIMIEAIISFIVVLGADELLYTYVDSYYHVEENVGLMLVLVLVSVRIIRHIPAWSEKLK